MYRPLSRTGADHLVVCSQMANGGHVSRSSPASGLRNAKALVEDGDLEDSPCYVGSFLCGCPFVKSNDGGPAHADSEAGGVVRQEVSDLLRRPGAGTQGVVGVGRGDFLRVAPRGRDGKSPAGVHRKANRCGLLRGVNGQSPVKKLSEKPHEGASLPTIRRLIAT